MHRRKEYLIYPPGYSWNNPTSKRYKIRYSRNQAWKLAKKMGEGSSVDVNIYYYESKHSFWTFLEGKCIWEITKGD